MCRRGCADGSSDRPGAVAGSGSHASRRAAGSPSRRRVISASSGEPRTARSCSMSQKSCGPPAWSFSTTRPAADTTGTGPSGSSATLASSRIRTGHSPRATTTSTSRSPGAVRRTTPASGSSASPRRMSAATSGRDAHTAASSARPVGDEQILIVGRAADAVDRQRRGADQRRPDPGGRQGAVHAQQQRRGHRHATADGLRPACRTRSTRRRAVSGVIPRTAHSRAMSSSPRRSASARRSPGDSRRTSRRCSSRRSSATDRMPASIAAAGLP